jgi:hypothetical protein
MHETYGRDGISLSALWMLRNGGQRTQGDGLVEYEEFGG